MFDVPDAKRVRREELLSRASSSRSPSPAPENTVTDGYQRLGELLNLDSLLAPTTSEQLKENDPTTEPPHEDEDEEQEFEFRLFSAPAGAGNQPHPSADATAPGAQDASGGGEGAGGTQKLRIRLRSPSPGAAGSGEGRIVNPFRGWEYYFTAPGLLSGTTVAGEDVEFQMKRRQFEDVAVSGENMQAWAKVDWPGCHLPWKVVRLRRDQTKLPRGSADPLNAAVTYVMTPPERTPKSVKKPGKKRRLQLRKRVTAAEDAKKQEAEKRNRKNREKKIKRRQKAREEKAAAAAAAGKDVPASPGDVDMLSQDGSD
ncbi:hypothetical protein BDW42DRAFT_179976 [Aspergillus taichungensis]|uniref:Uncharacterized protein n=1 Tax=Aspergillus taichungensis TaxID=482145 RepID=A0A2J5HG88_9EURO|nr:hypothetical protein BDW42DRAFT_179976 [Aspergillus taichungensis]